MPTSTEVEDLVLRIALSKPSSRREIWTQVVRELPASRVLEIGVWKGEHAEHILRHCPQVSRYYLLDPWKHLSDWNKPWNVEQPRFEEIYREALQRTEFAGDRRTVLRGETAEVIDAIPDGELDLAYVDGDHTLRGIAIDLIRAYPKIRPGGILGGDDYTRTIWQHSDEFEPSLVCPFASYFAESQRATIVILPLNQFAIIKPAGKRDRFRFVDTTQSYGPRSLLSQIRRARIDQE